MRFFLALPIFVVFLVTSVAAEDFAAEKAHNWHQWRGPEATGYAPLADPPLEWSQEKNIRWKVEVPGRGTSTPIVWGDRVFLLTAIKTDRVIEVPAEKKDDAGGGGADAGAAQDEPPAKTERADDPQRDGTGERRGGRGGPDGFGRGAGGGGRGFGRGGFGGMRVEKPNNYYQFVVLCLDRKTGKVLWQQIATEQVPHEGHHRDHGFASASPTTDGKHLYVSFGSRGIYCFDLDGKLKWSTDLGDMSTHMGFGEAISPVIHGDSLVVNWDHQGDSFLTVLDARTGEPRWKVARNEGTTWATPLVIDHGGRTQIIVNATGRTRSYDLATGDVIWACGGQAASAIPCPVAADGFVFCMTGFRGSALYAIPLDAQGDITDTDKVAWHRHEGTSYVPSPLLYGDLLYFTNSNSGLLSVVDIKTGEPVIDRKRLPDLSNVYASPVGAAGRVYYTGRDGTVVVLKEGREFEVLATNRLDEGMDASPALVGKQLFLRGDAHLYCIERQ